MAYKTRRKLKCDYAGCLSDGSWDVYSTHNDLVGQYCAKHADRQVRNLTAFEQKWTEAARHRT